MNNNIIFIGHTGVGKTSIGEKLSIYMKKEFFDIDKKIENKLNIKIKEIFKIYGENYFRILENNFLKKFLKYKNIILSTGSGIVDNEKNLKILKKIGIIIYLKIDIKKSINRIINLNNRPLLNNYKKDNKKKIFIDNLFKNREIIYEKISNIIINTNNKNINEIIENIFNIINKLEKNKKI